ncbi:MAG: hypothetical protein F4Z60_06235 [Chloroflexi bacterium]|nr:hypothetical protein [Chloroflexota bacterium]
MAETSEVQLAQAMTMNCYAHAYVARAAFGEFRRGDRGSLLIVTHALGDQPAAGSGVYALACAATLGLARTLLTEHDEPTVAITTLLRGGAAFDASAGNLANASAEADEAEADALAALAVRVAASPAGEVTGRVLSAADAP